MEWHLLLKHLFWVLIIFVQINGYRGCFEEERSGLLQFKDFVRRSSSTTAVHDLLPSWVVDDTKSSDCCQWERVTCSSTTGHVIDLSFHNIKQISNQIYYTVTDKDEDFEIWKDNLDHKRWLLNVSLFGVFTELRSLNLSLNLIGGWNENEGFDTLSRLKMLETLDLGYNYFNRSIVQSLSALTSLKNLILKYNELEGSFPSQELSVFKNLNMLDLQYNYLNGSLSMQELANLRSLKVLNLQNNNLNGILQIQATLDSLEILDLSINNFIGSIPPSIGALSSLKALSLSANQLDGSLPSQGLCELKKLEELDLGQNMLEGTLPQCLNNLTSLRLLDLSLNLFTGTISSSLIANLNALEYIDFSHNMFEGLFSFSLFANHSKLEVVQFISDNNKFEIENENPSRVPLFQLKVLVLGNCNLNKLSNGISMFLLHQYSLRVVDLSHNKLKGSFPDWLLNNNTRLEFLSLQNNSFMGEFCLPLYPNKNTFWVDVSDNHFDGQLQRNITTVLPQLWGLNLSRNAFQGYLPSSICDIKNLSVLDVSFNNFSGEVPVKLVSACMNLEVLKLSHNNFHGQIFSEHFNLTTLSILDLNDNQFTGTLSNVVTRCSYLYSLDISNNYMSGNIPPLIGNLTNLYTLIMRNNSFDGQIPCELVSPNFLDLSHNSFTGSLHPCLNLHRTSHMYLQGNNFTGSIPKAIFNSSYLLTLDIRDNYLLGSIPDSIGTVSSLRVLSLGGNHLTGTIPSQLCQLNKIGIMDLSRNSFSGSIPRCFHNITFGKIGDNDISFDIHWNFFTSRDTSYKYRTLLKKTNVLHNRVYEYQELDEVQFVTKYRPSSYKGKILNLMSGLDLSHNNLTGGIPDELGKLSSIHALNLSYNQLTGSIPRSFSNLTELESLDLSHNKLTGGIPSQLIELHFLAVFTVGHNNLSGTIPDKKAQFGTFDASSYEGNPFLCGPPLENNCTRAHHDSPPPPTNSPNISDEKWYEIDLVVFFASFSVSFLIFFIGVVIVLYVNPYWQRRCFNLIEDHMYTCYYFVVDTLRKLSAHLC